MSPAPSSETLVEAAVRILNTADPFEKARLGDQIANQWLQGLIALPYSPSQHLSPPDRPARPANVKLVSPGMMPKLGKAGSLQSRQAIVHSLVHTESWAIDLSWDIIARFGKQECMPRDFFTDFVKVAQDEGRHFSMLAKRLEELGSFYGALPAHDGLWDSAMDTSKDLLARIAIEHCVHKARGLDVVPTTISRFRNGGDDQTADLLETVVCPEEFTHCAAGLKWFRYLCLRSRSQEGEAAGNLTTPVLSVSEEDGDGEVVEKFHEVVQAYFREPSKVRTTENHEGKLLGEGSTVAVIDSGIRSDHIEFKESVKSEFKYIKSWGFGDTKGHGSHVASTVAGKHCGIAPLSKMRIYKARDINTPLDKVERCFVRSMGEAMYRAIYTHRVDVISISYGPYGEWEPFSEDVIAMWASVAAMEGILVCVPAGNSGDEVHSLENVASYYLTVGGVDISKSYDAKLELGDGTTVWGSSMFSPEYLQQHFSETRHYHLQDFESVKELRNHISKLGKLYLEDKIVVLPDHERVRDTWELIQNSGGAGLIILNKEGDESLNCYATVSVDEDGPLLKDYIRRHFSVPTCRISFSHTRDPKPATPYRIYQYSSRGPCPPATEFSVFNALKPDVVASAVDVLGASHQNPEKYVFKTGTSMATPHVAAIAAIVKALKEWSPERIKSAIMSSTIWKDIVDVDGEPASAFVMGSGLVNLHGALNPGLVYDDDIPGEYLTTYFRGLGYSDHTIATRMLLLDQVPDMTSARPYINYPTFAINFGDGESVGKKIVCERTVTNVGPDDSRYEYDLQNPPGVEMTVHPPVLQFSSSVKSLKYTVEFELTRNLPEGRAHGSLTWVGTNCSHSVRSAIGVVQEDKLGRNPTVRVRRHKKKEAQMKDKEEKKREEANDWEPGTKKVRRTRERRDNDDESGTEDALINGMERLSVVGDDTASSDYLRPYFIRLLLPDSGPPNDDYEGWYHSFLPVVSEDTHEDKKPRITTACNPKYICGFFALLSPQHLKHVESQHYFLRVEHDSPLHLID